GQVPEGDEEMARMRPLRPGERALLERSDQGLDLGIGHHRRTLGFGSANSTTRGRERVQGSARRERAESPAAGPRPTPLDLTRPPPTAAPSPRGSPASG